MSDIPSYVSADQDNSMVGSWTGSITLESLEEPVLASSAQYRQWSTALPRRRRHSSCHSLACYAGTDDLQVSVDRFLLDLNRRLDFIESYGQIHIDASIESAWSALHAVRDACGRVSDGVLDAGCRKASVLVETLYESYNEALARKETLEQQVNESFSLMDSWLADFESRAYALKENGIGISPYDIIHGGRRKVDSGFVMAKDVASAGLDMARGAAETIEIAVESALAKARKQGLISIQDLPDPWKFNPHIIHGYRFHDTFTGCIRSALSISNELFNIWSHLIGLVLVLGIAFYFYPASDHFSLSSKTDIFVAGIFFFAACECLICSIIWHTFNSMAEARLIATFACVDYTGISFLIAASILTTEYTAFYCEPFWRWFWISTTSIFGIAGTILPWNSTFNRHDLAWLRVTFYVCLSATGMLPSIQLCYLHGPQWTAHFYAPILKSFAVYLGGATLYAQKIPERWFPGVFDYIGGSHNIWHVAVLGGIFFHYHAMQEFFAKAFLRAEVSCSVS